MNKIILVLIINLVMLGFIRKTLYGASGGPAWDCNNLAYKSECTAACKNVTEAVRKWESGETKPPFPNYLEYYKERMAYYCNSPAVLQNIPSVTKIPAAPTVTIAPSPVITLSPATPTIENPKSIENKTFMQKTNIFQVFFNWIKSIFHSKFM